MNFNPFLSGNVHQMAYGDGDALAIGDTYLAEYLEHFKNKMVYCVYAFSDQVITLEKMLTMNVLSTMGEVDATLYNSYSEITGYLWTNEDGEIGGHDLIDIFENHEGEWGAIIVSEQPIDLTSMVENSEEYEDWQLVNFKK